ncbi:MAG: molybdopterin-binding protein [Syntrophobacteraceae bacterium]|jgi:hypothetical protein|nr:molybdopterin-binding protein [Syntrophobacteraceae bacterium]
MLKEVNLENAVGMVLAHDITEIRRGEFKGAAFRKGHRVREADICHLQRLGKSRLYVLEVEEGYLHEDDAAVTLAEAFCGLGVIRDDEPGEGRIRLYAGMAGLFKVDVEALFDVNLSGEIACASRHTGTLVQKGETLAAVRSIPLIIRSAVVDEAVRISKSRGGLFSIAPLMKARVGLVITGNEVFTGLVQDQFEPVLRRKIQQIGSIVTRVAFAPDDVLLIARNLRMTIAMGVDLVLITGGMSVDPDDVTCKGVKLAGACDFIHGAPVLPGSMFMIARIGRIPVMGIPACGIYHDATILDLVLPRVLAGEHLTRRDLAVLGHGGLCLHCGTCRFPACPFGKSC